MDKYPLRKIFYFIIRYPLKIFKPGIRILQDVFILSKKEVLPMYPTRWMRLLRLKHRVTHRELAEAAQVSRQRIIEIELGTDYTTEYQRQLVAKAFRSVITKRGADGAPLEKDFEKLESRLLEYAKDGEELL